MPKRKMTEAVRERIEQSRDAARVVARQEIGLRNYEPDDLEMITSELYAVRATGEAKRPLRDSKCEFHVLKRKALDVRRLYNLMDDHDHADKLAGCSTHLEYWENGDGSKKTLHFMNACQFRLCPICANRKARRAASRLARVLDAVDEAHKRQYRALFLTLTVRNCKAEDLRATLDLLTRAWAKLRRRRCFARAVRGWFRAIEITYNRETGEYHPHIHAILLVDRAYYADRNAKAVTNGLYIRQGADADEIAGYSNPTWIQMWRESLQVDYDPSVRVSAVYRKNNDTDAATMSAVYEAAKYATKDADYLAPGMSDDEAVAVLRTYTHALTRKRLTAMGGWIQEAADKLAVSVDTEDIQDTVHDDEDAPDALTSETAEYVAVYGFRFRYGDYFLRDRWRNPDYQGGSPGLKGGGNDVHDQDVRLRSDAPEADGRPDGGGGR